MVFLVILTDFLARWKWIFDAFRKNLLQTKAALNAAHYFPESCEQSLVSE